MNIVFSSLMLVLSLSTVVSALINQTQVLGLGSANTVLIGGAGFFVGELSGRKWRGLQNVPVVDRFELPSAVPLHSSPLTASAHSSAAA